MFEKKEPSGRLFESRVVTVRVGKGDTRMLSLPRCTIYKAPQNLQNEILCATRCKGVVSLPEYNAEAFSTYMHWLQFKYIDVSDASMPKDALEKRKVELHRLHKAKDLAETLGDDAYFEAADQVMDYKISLVHTICVYAQASKQAIDDGIDLVKKGIAYVKNAIDLAKKGVTHVNNGITHLRNGLSRLGRIAKVLLRGATTVVKLLNKTVPL